jgi:hypothetical protein
LIWAYNRRADLVLLPNGAQSTQYFPGTVAESRLLFNSEWPGGKDIITLAAEKEALPVDSTQPNDNK